MDSIHVWTVWKHKNECLYRVVGFANMQTTNPDKYPKTVIYESIDTGYTWCRPIEDWHKSMTLVDDPV